MADLALDFVLEEMMQLINCNSPSMLGLEKKQMVCLYEEMQFLRKFLMDSVEARTDEHKEVRDLVAKIRDVTREVDDIIDSFVLMDFVQTEISMRSGLDVTKDFELNPCFRIGMSNKKGLKANQILKDVLCFVDERLGYAFSVVMEEINFIKTKAREIYAKNMYGTGVMQAPEYNSHGGSAFSRATSPVVEEENTVVGMDDARIAVIEQLVAEHEKHLKVIPIIGMPGLGKTTLARKVYDDPFVIYHFHVRVWTCVTQDYSKRDLLLSILSSAKLIISLDDIDQKSKGTEELGETLYRGLKGNKYLIFMDDVWDIEVWNDLKRYFPDDKNGSRVVFTSRHVDVAVHAEPHHLRFLNEEESWALLRIKVFRKESCPPELTEIGKKIAKKCQGLPLAILIVSGLLRKSDKTVHWWRHVSESVRSYIISEPEQYMATLGLSYNHLPFHLKPCFLYFGVFPEDYEIAVPNLLWLWVAEGFIQRNMEKSLEEVAEEFLMDLVDRSLVVVSKKSSDGRIKTCRVHDLLRDLCLRRAKEENFLMLISRFEHMVSPFFGYMVNKNPRVSLHSESQYCRYLKDHAFYARSFLSFECYSIFDLPSIWHDFKLLRVLNLLSNQISFFPDELEFMVHLRYLAFRACNSTRSFQLSLSNFWNLETLIITGSMTWNNLPDCVWKMMKLRHLYIVPSFKIPPRPKEGCSFISENLQSINCATFSDGDELVFTCSPNIRRLKCYVKQSMDRCIHFPKLGFLSRLQKLSVWGAETVPVTLPHAEEFPQSLKCLTLSNLLLPWEAMSIFGRLPNLEVLKLLYRSFEGSRWDTRDGEFRKLRFLKLYFLDIKQWNSSANHFPNLQTLVLDCCGKLEEIPYDFGEIYTLKMIWIGYCGRSATCSARQIQKLQQSMGNDEFTIRVEGAGRTVFGSEDDIN